jgi:hypothetical protein
LYLFSFIGLIVSVIGTIQLVDLGMKIYVFKDADKFDTYPPTTMFDPNGKEIPAKESDIKAQEEFQDRENKRNRQRQTSTALSMLLVGIPLYKYHWKLIRKEDK